MGLRHTRDFGFQAPPLFLVYVEMIREPGDEANLNIQYKEWGPLYSPALLAPTPFIRKGSSAHWYLGHYIEHAHLLHPVGAHC